MVMQIVAGIASIFVFFSFFMKTMIPLRIIAIISNVTFITYALLGIRSGIFLNVYPIFILHTVLLPLNLIRLYQMKTLIRKVNEASQDQSEVNYLIPYMTKNVYKKSDNLFMKEDLADKIFFIQEGSVFLPEVNKVLPKGTVFGEIGIFAPDNRRAASAICSDTCVVYEIHRDKVLELFYQNPKFGFYLIRSVSRIAKENLEKIPFADNDQINPPTEKHDTD